jgi:23S rRNA pseudouridine1911/1915/1917 synthase
MIKSPDKIAEDQYRPLGGGPLTDNDAGQRLDRYLASRYPFYTRSGWQKKIHQNEVLINFKSAKASYFLKKGDCVAMLHKEEIEPEVNKNVFCIWQNGPVMALYKPANLPMHANGPYCKNTFSHIVRTEFGKEWSSVHRLDLETSGIVLCAATSESRKILSAAFAHCQVSKEYLAIVNGAATDDAWDEHGPIGQLIGSTIRIKKWVVKDGLPAETRFSVLDRKAEYSLLKAEPKTGRTNQIRIHCAVKGHPIVGDKLYHPDENVFQQYFENGNTAEVIEQTGFFRLCLHAARITFPHPETRKHCEVETPLPDELKNLWASLPES